MFFKSEQPENVDSMTKLATSFPQKYSMAFFQDYFDEGGTIDHPALGNLLELADKIDAQYNSKGMGINLVSSFIRYKLEQLSNCAAIIQC